MIQDSVPHHPPAVQNLEPDLVGEFTYDLHSQAERVDGPVDGPAGVPGVGPQGAGAGRSSATQAVTSVECTQQRPSGGWDVDGELVVSAAEVCMKACPATTICAVLSVRNLRIDPSRCSGSCDRR